MQRPFGVHLGDFSTLSPARLPPRESTQHSHPCRRLLLASPVKAHAQSQLPSPVWSPKIILACSWTSNKWNYTVCSLLCPTPSAQNDVVPPAHAAVGIRSFVFCPPGKFSLSEYTMICSSIPFGGCLGVSGLRAPMNRAFINCTLFIHLFVCLFIYLTSWLAIYWRSHLGAMAGSFSVYIRMMSVYLHLIVADIWRSLVTDNAGHIFMSLLAMW